VSPDAPDADLPGHWHRLRALVQRETGCEAAAADAVQEAYLRWFAKPDRADVENPGGYLYQAALNIARTLRTRSGREQAALRLLAVDETTIADDRSPERACLDEQKLRDVMRRIDQLPPRCREVFVLYRFHGIDQGEIARRLGISRNMVERHVIRAMRDCRDTLRDDG